MYWGQFSVFQSILFSLLKGQLAGIHFVFNPRLNIFLWGGNWNPFVLKSVNACQKLNILKLIADFMNILIWREKDVVMNDTKNNGGICYS